jgi:hypothetical protein
LFLPGSLAGVLLLDGNILARGQEETGGHVDHVADVLHDETHDDVGDDGADEDVPGVALGLVGGEVQVGDADDEEGDGDGDHHVDLQKGQYTMNKE